MHYNNIFKRIEQLSNYHLNNGLNPIEATAKAYAENIDSLSNKIFQEAPDAFKQGFVTHNILLDNIYFDVNLRAQSYQFKVTLEADPDLQLPSIISEGVRNTNEPTDPSDPSDANKELGARQPQVIQSYFFELKDKDCLPVDTQSFPFSIATYYIEYVCGKFVNPVALDEKLDMNNLVLSHSITKDINLYIEASGVLNLIKVSKQATTDISIVTDSETNIPTLITIRQDINGILSKQYIKSIDYHELNIQDTDLVFGNKGVRNN